MNISISISIFPVVVDTPLGSYGQGSGEMSPGDAAKRRKSFLKNELQPVAGRNQGNCAGTSPAGATGGRKAQTLYVKVLMNMLSRPGAQLPWDDLPVPVVRPLVLSN